MRILLTYIIVIYFATHFAILHNIHKLFVYHTFTYKKILDNIGHEIKGLVGFKKYNVMYVY